MLAPPAGTSAGLQPRFKIALAWSVQQPNQRQGSAPLYSLSGHTTVTNYRDSAVILVGAGAQYRIWP